MARRGILWQVVANGVESATTDRVETARAFLRRFVRFGAANWREEDLAAWDLDRVAQLPHVQCQLPSRDEAAWHPDVVLKAIEDGLRSAIEQLPDPQSLAALAQFGFSPTDARVKSKTRREELAAPLLGGSPRGFRARTPKFGGMKPADWLLEQVVMRFGAEVDHPLGPSALGKEETWDHEPAPERYAASGSTAPEEGPGKIGHMLGAPQDEERSATASSARRSLDWEGFYSAIAELGGRLFADKAYGGFYPDAVVGVNHGGAIVAGLLYYARSRSFEIFTITARGDDFVSSPDHLKGLVELADRHQRPIRLLLVDDSMKSGESLQLARGVVEAALGGRDATIRVAVLVYRPDYHELAGGSCPAPDLHVHTDIDDFPYGRV